MVAVNERSSMWHRWVPHSSVPAHCFFLFACAIAAAGSVTNGFSQAPSGSPARLLSLRACNRADIPGGGRCGTYDVYENRTTNTGRILHLNVVVLPATGATPQADPIVWLEGGPGGAATQAAGPVSQQYFRGARMGRDLVFVDQRGTGSSNPLKCGDIGETPANLDGYFGKLFPPDLIRACRMNLERVADLAQYNTTIAMDDLDDVLEALGYAQVNLAGASYGTLAAQVYIRRHPTRVRSALLFGVVTPDYRLPLPFAKAAQNALEQMFDDCDVAPECRDTFPHIRQEFDVVLARFASGSLRVTMSDPLTGADRTVALERESYVEHLRAMLYSTSGARLVPLVVHHAFLNDFKVFQTMAVRYNLGGPATSRGVFFSTTCAESIPFISQNDIVAATRGTFVGDRRVRAHIEACREWRQGAVSPAFVQPVISSLPVLMLSGAADGTTPPGFASDAITRLPNGRQVIAPHTGHQISGPCMWNIMTSFVEKAAAGAVDASCVEALKRPPFATAVP